MLGDEEKFLFGEFMGGVFHRFEKDDLLLTDFGDETLSVALGVALVEAVAMRALRVAVVLGEPRCHVLSVDVVTAVGLCDGQQSVARCRLSCCWPL